MYILYTFIACVHSAAIRLIYIVLYIQLNTCPNNYMMSLACLADLNALNHVGMNW